MAEPYVFVGGPNGAGFHALVAARVRHWPFSRLTEHVWVDRDDEFKVQLQLLDRQLRFLTALHPGQARLATHTRATFELRYAHRPGVSLVDCVLLGKVFDPADADAARAGALALYESAATAMPIGYELQPAATEAEFRDWSGADIAQYAEEHKAWVELRRPAEFLLWTDDSRPARYLPLVYPYRWEPSGWDVVWAAQARLAAPALISVSLRPTAVDERDERILSDLLFELATLAQEARPPLSTRAAEAAAWYQTYVHGLRTSFSVRVSVLGAPALRWAIRSALSGPAWLLEEQHTGSDVLQAEVAEPADAEWPIVRGNFDYLEQELWGPNPWGGARLLPIIERLRFLTDPAGALCAFRLPLLPPAGLPGVLIGDEVNLGER